MAVSIRENFHCARSWQWLTVTKFPESVPFRCKSGRDSISQGIYCIFLPAGRWQRFWNGASKFMYFCCGILAGNRNVFMQKKFLCSFRRYILSCIRLIMRKIPHVNRGRYGPGRYGTGTKCFWTFGTKWKSRRNGHCGKKTQQQSLKVNHD